MTGLALAVLWTASGFMQPESVAVDEAAGVLYVSNVNGKTAEKDGNGFISKVDAATGKIVKLKWATGLNSPTGLALCGGKLYAADVDAVAVVSLATGKVEGRWAAPGARFINDVVADKKCAIYASDMFLSAIYKSAGSELKGWMDGPALQSPNGLQLLDGKLIVAAWGLTTDGSTKTPGQLLGVDLVKQAIGPVLGPHGHLDGLQRYKDGWLATDWVEGTLIAVAANGGSTVLKRGLQGPADLACVRDAAYLPEMNAGTLTAFRLSQPAKSAKR